MGSFDLRREGHRSRGKTKRGNRFQFGASVAVTAMLTMSVWSATVHADEGGVSYWLPGRFGSLAATPQIPGWSMAEVYYHTSVSAFGNAAAAREIQVGRIPATVNVDLNLHLNAQADLMLLNPTYTFATPVLGVATCHRRDRTIRAVERKS